MTVSVPVVAVCGRRRLERPALHAAGIDAVYSLLDLDPDPQRYMKDPEPLLEELGRQIARNHIKTRI